MFYSSIEGAHHEAMEASAEHLMLFVDNTANRNSSPDATSSEGYSSDIDTLNNPGFNFEVDACGSDSSSLSGDDVDITSPSSSGASNDTTKADEDIEDDISHTSNNTTEDDSSIENEIAYLQEKQGLLHRAVEAMKREDNYEASRARNIVNGKFEHPTAAIWGEAREVLDVLDGGDGSKRPTSSREDKLTPARDGPPSKKTKIDLSSVLCISSASLDKQISSGKEDNNKSYTPTSMAIPYPCQSSNSMPFCATGPWMGEALAKTVSSMMPPSVVEDSTTSKSSSSNTASTKGWEIVNDSNAGLLVVPPSLQSMSYGVELKDALALTPQARLVTLSTPPFNVVHANKGFCNLSDGFSSIPFVGKPIESLLQKKHGEGQGFTLTTANNPKSSNCQLRVVPVTDRYRNPRGGISHLMVTVYGSEDTSVERQGNSGLSSFLSSAATAGAKEKGTHHDIAPHHHRVFETVG